MTSIEIYLATPEENKKRIMCALGYSLLEHIQMIKKLGFEGVKDFQEKFKKEVS